MILSDEELRKRFPNLAGEVKNSMMRVKVDSIRSNAEVNEAYLSKSFTGYNPDIIDFLRRCVTEREAIDIIEFMEKRRAISSGYANDLRRQLKIKGLRSFGKKKTSNYYLKKSKT